MDPGSSKKIDKHTNTTEPSRTRSASRFFNAMVLSALNAVGTEPCYRLEILARCSDFITGDITRTGEKIRPIISLLCATFITMRSIAIGSGDVGFCHSS